MHLSYPFVRTWGTVPGSVALANVFSTSYAKMNKEPS